MTPDQHRTAKYVIAWLAKAEDPDNPDYPVARIKAERWGEVCAAVAANPDLSAKTIAERLGAELGIDRTESKPHAAPITNRDTATAPWRPATAEERRIAHDRLAEIRSALTKGTNA